MVNATTSNPRYRIIQMAAVNDSGTAAIRVPDDTPIPFGTQPDNPPDASLYTHFDITMPAADASLKEKDTALQALHKAITAYNASVEEDNRVLPGGHYYEYKYTASKTQPVVTQTDPGLIRSGGAMTLIGTNLINDKSRIIAGGALLGDHGNLRNIGIEGTATTTINGTVRYLSKSRSGRPRASGYSPYIEAPRSETVTLPLYQVESHTQTAPMTRAIDTGSAVSPVAMLSVPSLTTTNQAPRAPSNHDIVLDKVDEFDLSRQAAVTASATPVSASNSTPVPLVSEQPSPNTTAEQTAPSTLTAEQTAPTVAATNQPMPQTVQPRLSATPREQIRTTQPNITLPTASLYTINPSAPATQPIIETDPRFTNQQQWMGSQLLRSAGNPDPNITQKRLGDNFYEQQLIRDQVGQLTGRRYLNGYKNDNDQYQALINNGVSIAQTFQLTPGIALTPEQMARLTSDIVWLVEKEITLPDGSTTKALVPQLYVKVQQGDLKGDGALIAGDSVQFNLSSDLHNSGTIAGRTLVDISAKNIHNHLGRIQAADARLSALLDIHNIGGAFAADHSMTMDAGQNITLEAGQQTHHFDAIQKQQSRSFLSSKNSTRADSVTDTQALSTTVSGNTVTVTAGNNILLTGSNAVSDKGTHLNAANNITVQNAQESHSESHFYQEKSSGLLGTGGVGVMIGTQQQSQDAKSTETSSSASTVGATNGNVNITAGKAYKQIGSDVMAFNKQDPTNTNDADNSNHHISAGKAYTQIGSDVMALNKKDPANTNDANHDSTTHKPPSSAPDVGHVTVTAQTIDILASQTQASQRLEQKTKQSGVTVAITNPLITAAQTVEKMQQAKDNTSDGRMKALADAASAAAVFNAGTAVAANPKQLGGVGISASIGNSQSRSVTEQQSTTLTASNIRGDGNVTMQATGAGADSNITVQASHINAGKDVNFKADNDVNLQAGKNTSEQHSKNDNTSASVGAGLSTSSGLTANIALSKGQGNADGEDIVYTHTNVNAGNQLNVQTGNDLNMKGATAQAKQITADIGRDLNIGSVQDKSTYDSEQKSAGVAVAVPIMGMGQGSASASMSKSNVDSNYLSVTQQSGLKAGDDGFDIKVQGNTDLKGGLIASTDQAAQTTDENGQPINQLTTGTLTTSDLNNKAEYEASSISVGIGTNATAGALNPAGMGWGNDSDSQTSTTKAGVSSATIAITDDNKQKQLTGKDAEQTVADLNRDVSTDKDTSGKLQNKFDANKVQNDIDAQTQITQTFGQQAAQAIGTIAQNKEQENKDQAKELIKRAEDQSNNLNHEERQALLNEAKRNSDEASKWGEGGAYRVALHTVAGGLAGNVAGAAAAATVAHNASKLSDLQTHTHTALKKVGASDTVANITSQIISQTTINFSDGTKQKRLTGENVEQTIAGFADIPEQK